MPRDAITYQYLQRDPSLLYFQHAKQLHHLYYRQQTYIIDQIEECIQYFHELYLVQLPQIEESLGQFEDDDDDDSSQGGNLLNSSKDSNKNEPEEEDDDDRGQNQLKPRAAAVKEELVAEGQASVSQFMKKQESMNRQESLYKGELSLNRRDSVVRQESSHLQGRQPDGSALDDKELSKEKD